jgi:hypothetical protein
MEDMDISDYDLIKSRMRMIIKRIGKSKFGVE